MNSKGIFITMEAMAAAKSAQLLSQFSQNNELIEKLLLGTKRTINSTSEIGVNLRNIITHLRNGSPDCDRMIKEATKKLASKI